MKSIMKIKLLMCVAVSCVALISCEKKSSIDFATAPHLSSDSFDSGAKADGAIRLVTYNVGMFNKDIANSYNYIGAMMTEVEADVVGMQEVYDSQHPLFVNYYGATDELFGAAGSKGNHYGNSLAVKGLEIVDSYVYQMSEVETDEEQRGFTVMEFEKFVFAVTHLDLVKTAQLEQVAVITKNLKDNYGESGKVVLLCGDMNATLGSDTMKAFLENFTVISSTTLSTFPAAAPNRCLDYILQLNNGVKCEVTYTDVLRSFKTGDVRRTSDHLPVAVDIVL